MKGYPGTTTLSAEHIAAVNRRRRVVVNCDASYYVDAFVDDLPASVDDVFTLADEPGSHIDSFWWSWGQGQTAPYPSELLPLYDRDKYRRWIAEGIDVAQLYLEATKRRGLEAFFSYRFNASDSDLGTHAKVPIKAEHPEWTIKPWKGHPGLDQVTLLNFEFEGVREYKLQVLREAAEKYDFDGIELDLQRTPIYFPAGHQWQNHEILTGFMREVRAMLQEIADRRGRPYLLAVRIGYDIEGCHFDGIDVETWAQEQLVDIFALGNRTLEADVYAFRRITAGTHIKLYPVIDDHHAADGYSYPPIEIFRGACSNWYRQGADGVQAFNFSCSPGTMHPEQQYEVQRLAYQEMGDAAALKDKDKRFVLCRRGGGHGDPIVPNPEDWYTPRHMYGYTNMLAPLPMALDRHGRADTILKLFVGDELAGEPERIEGLTLRLLLHDEAGEYVHRYPGRKSGGAWRIDEADDAAAVEVDPETPPPSVSGRIGRGVIRIFMHRDFLYNHPPACGIENRIEVRINNTLLTEPRIEDGWLVFQKINPMLFAIGNNMIGVLVKLAGPGQVEALLVEKLELHVEYRGVP